MKCFADGGLVFASCDVDYMCDSYDYDYDDDDNDDDDDDDDDDDGDGDDDSAAVNDDGDDGGDGGDDGDDDDDGDDGDGSQVLLALKNDEVHRISMGFDFDFIENLWIDKSGCMLLHDSSTVYLLLPGTTSNPRRLSWKVHATGSDADYRARGARAPLLQMAGHKGHRK